MPKTTETIDYGTPLLDMGKVVVETNIFPFVERKYYDKAHAAQTLKYRPGSEEGMYRPDTTIVDI